MENNDVSNRQVDMALYRMVFSIEAIVANESETRTGFCRRMLRIAHRAFEGAYIDAGSPYGETEEGFTRWMREKAVDNGYNREYQLFSEQWARYFSPKA